MNKDKVLLPGAILILGKKKNRIKQLTKKANWKINAIQVTGEMKTRDSRLILQYMKYPYWSSLVVMYSPHIHEEQVLFSIKAYQIKGRKDQVLIEPVNGWEKSSDLINKILDARKCLNQILPRAMRIPPIFHPPSLKGICF